MKPKVEPGDTVWFWWNASYCYAVTFIRWAVGRNDCGGPNTNKMGVRAIVKSNWLFDRCVTPRIDRGLRRGYASLRPYTELYKRRPYGFGKKGKPLPVQRPTVRELRARRKRSKV